MIPVALTMAGSDPSGGAGIQADLKTFHQQGVYGEAVITLLTVQNSRGVKSVRLVEPKYVLAQLNAVLKDIPPRAAKMGALGSAEMVCVLARAAGSFRFPLIVDPVMLSKNNFPFLKKEALPSLKKKLLPVAVLVTPNLLEAEALSGEKVNDLKSMERAARIILRSGAKSVLIKGGHLKGDAIDLFCDRRGVEIFRARRIRTTNTHGTGCTFSAVITAEMAQGRPLVEAIWTAKKFISRALEKSLNLGKGRGPVNHFVSIGRV